MSEKAPTGNSRLDNFDENRDKFEAEYEAALNEAHEENDRMDREHYEDVIYGEAGKTDFSDEARQRLEEADEYMRHMEAMKNRDKNYTPFNDLENQPSPAYDAEIDEATELNNALNAAEAEVLEENRKAVNDKINNSPSLRRMDAIAADIAQMRENNVDAHRIQLREDALNELLAQYEAADDYDAVVADELMDRTVPKVEEVETDADDAEADGEAETSGDKAPDIDDDHEPLGGDRAPELDGDDDGDDEHEPLRGDEAPELDDDHEPLDGDRAPDLDDDDDDHEPLRGDRAPDLEDGERTPDGGEEARRSFWKRMRGEPGSRERSRFKKVVVGIGIVAAATAAAVVMHKTGTLPTVSGVRDWFDSTFGNGSDVPQAELPADGGNTPEGEGVIPELPNADTDGGNDFGGTDATALPGGDIEAARTVVAGEGWGSTLEQIGFSASELTPELYDKILAAGGELGDWTYTMSDGLPGINKPGTLPDSVIEQLKSLR